MTGVRCLQCGEPLSHMDIGTVAEVTEAFWGGLRPGKLTHSHRHGTINQPCGCVDGGLSFDFTEPAS